jgi:malate/lactate dehydrogenase
MNVLIIGVGKIGSLLAYELVKDRSCNVFLYGRNYSKNKGIASDLREINAQFNVVALESLEHLPKIDLTIFSFSIMIWRPNIGANDRIIEAKNNLKILDSIASQIDLKQLGVIIIVSNPVDLLTQYCSEKYKVENVYGFGNSLDELRVSNTLINRPYNYQGDEVVCIGEHGSSIVPILSKAFGESIVEPSVYSNVKSEIFERTLEVIHLVSIPFYAPVYSLFHLIRSIINQETKTVRLSRYLKKEYLGIKGISIGVPLEMINGQLGEPVEIDVSDYEAKLFVESAKQIETVYNKIVHLE